MLSEVIHSQKHDGGKLRLVFSFVDGDKVFGPFVEDRPLNEDVNAFVSSRKTLLQNELSKPDPYIMMEQALDTHVGPGTYVALRKALKDIGGEFVNLDGLQLQVTFPTVTNPEDPEAALRERVDSVVGVGALEGVKAVLRAMGITKAEVQRKSIIAL